ncbi:MAG TPA: YraN family protein [Dongiaceae bacterium]
MKTERQRAWRRGRAAERLAILALTLTGYHIVARNLKLGLGEIDIVARRGRVIAFIEVKSRADWGRAAESILVRQRQRIARAASAFLAARPQLAGHQPRFDVMLVVPWRWPRHILNSWRIDS